MDQLFSKKQYRKQAIGVEWENASIAWKVKLSPLEKLLSVFLFGQIIKTLSNLFDIKLPIPNAFYWIDSHGIQKPNNNSADIYFTIDNDMHVYANKEVILKLQNIIKTK